MTWELELALLVVAGLVVAVLVARTGAVARWLSRTTKHGAKRLRSLPEQKAIQRSSDERATLERNVVLRAQVIGKRVAVSKRGHAPAVVTFSDGEKVAFFDGDLGAYKRAMEQGQVRPTHAQHTNAPKLVNEQPTAELQAWLDEHRDDEPA